MGRASKWGRFTSFTTEKFIFRDVIKFDFLICKFSTVIVYPAIAFIALNAVIRTINSTFFTWKDFRKRIDFVTLVKSEKNERGTPIN